MIDLATEIPLLLFRYQSIHIPEIGVFSRNKQSSSIKKNDSKILLTPPKETILFKENPIENTTLINHFVFNLHISFEEAQRQINDQVAAWKKKLDQGEEIIFKNFGKLKKSPHDFYQFQSDENYLISDEIEFFLEKKSTVESKILLFFLVILIVILFVLFAVVGYLIYTFGFQLAPPFRSVFG